MNDAYVLLHETHYYGPFTSATKAQEWAAARRIWQFTLIVLTAPDALPMPDYSGYNAPFCRSPEKCGPVGRCLSEIACND